MTIKTSQLSVLFFFSTFIAGCNSSKLVGEWQNPTYKNVHLKKVLVLGIGHRIDVRRNFEDEFVKQLATRGIDAVPGYQFIPESEKVDQATLERAVAQSGAQAILMTRLVRVENQVSASPGYYNAYAPGVYGYYNYAWGGYYEPPQVYTDQVVTAETTLIDSKSGAVIWSGSTQTFNPSDLSKDIRDLVKVLISGMSKSGAI